VRSIRRERPPVDVAPGERLLAWAPVVGGQWVAGTRDALYLPAGRLAWEEVEAADWDHELARLRVSEVGQWGRPRVEHTLTLDETAPFDTDRLLQLVRERVTASVLLVRHVPITGKRGVRVVGRRAPSGRSEVHWVYEYDAGIEPTDPVVQAAASAALASARADVGLD
jgi:hypothetical protein